MRLARFAFAAAAALSVALPANAQETWSWNKSVAAGRTIEIKGINGDVMASAASGAEVQVIAKKRAKRSDTESVRLVVVEHTNGVTICALYPDAKRGEANECQPGHKGR